MTRLATLVPRLTGHRVAVVGDVVLDEYLYGRPERLSREAAIPVLEWEQRRVVPGGAANPAANIAALDSSATLIGIIGADTAGTELQHSLHERHVATTELIVDSSRPTTTKTRILASVQLAVAQQVARLDRIERRVPDPSIEAVILNRLEHIVPLVDAVLCSDYRIGCLSQRVVQQIALLCRQHGKLLTVDSQGRFDPYAGADFLKCNTAEASFWLDQPLRSDTDFDHALRQLQKQLDLRAAVITRGGAGFSLIAHNDVHHVPALPIGEVFDATGAGDTFVAVATLGLVAELGALDATHLANAASALVVRRIGVAVVSPAELSAALQQHA